MQKETVYRIFSNIPSIKTERLNLRKIYVSDYEDMYEYAHLASVPKYLTWYPHPSKQYTKEYLQYVSTQYNIGNFYDWAVTLKEEGRMIGTCGFTRFNFTSNSGEVGYVLNPDYHGRGIATEAVRQVMKFGFEELGLHRIECKFMEGNEASRRVMERVGMKFEGYSREAMLVKHQYRTIGTYSILENEYRAIYGDE
jgi:ribosomal-protein-alanine N-acetyltransferase